MASWGILFLLLAVVSAVFGFGVLSGTAMMAAKICFGVFLIIAILSLFTGREVRV